MEHEQQIPIWFFIGALLAVYGVMIMGVGVYGLFVPPDVKLAEYHAPLWWGAIMLAVGAFYCIRFNPLKSGRS
jgi:hypothetical protein